MKLLKKVAAFALAGATVLGMAGCGKSGGTSTGKSYSIGIVQYVDHASLNQIEANIEKELKAKEKELGVTFNVTLKNGQADGTTLNQIVSDFADSKVDMIIPIATPAAMIAIAGTEGKNIPIVFSAVSDPVTAKIVDSMDKPGGNVTGTSDGLNTEALCNMMVAADKKMDTVGLLYSKSESASEKPIKEAKEFFKKNGIKVVEKTGSKEDEVRSAADALIAAKVDAVFTPTDNTIMNAELAIYEKFTAAKIPHYCGANSFAVNGAFVGYGVDYAQLGSATADMAADILVNEKDVATYPVQTLDNGITTINTETCEALGLKLDEVKKVFSEYSQSIEEVKTSEEV